MKCLRCGHYWATDAPREWITGKICPDCIPAFIPHRLGDDPPTNHPEETP